MLTEKIGFASALAGPGSRLGLAGRARLRDNAASAIWMAFLEFL
jgi:hypothetical protein